MAQRGSVYAARSEFIQALRLVAQQRDAQVGTDVHRRAVDDGFLALDEADDFGMQRAVRLEHDDLVQLVADHQTPVLKQTPLEQLTPSVAVDRYSDFARDRLFAAVGYNRVASMALYGLARLQPLLATTTADRDFSRNRIVALHRAAVAADAQNYLSYNELGVQLVRSERLDEARQALIQSLTIAPRPEAWRNLAVVYQRLEQPGAAQRAQFRYNSAKLNQNLASGPREISRLMQPAPLIRWVDNDVFKRRGPVTALPRPGSSRRTAAFSTSDRSSSQSRHIPLGASALPSIDGHSWPSFAQGEYVEPFRFQHVPQYHLRVDDLLEIVFRITAERISRPYRLVVGDTVRVESLTDKTLDRQVFVEPDGVITLPQVGRVEAEGRTLAAVQEDLEQRYRKYIREPSITVSPVEINSRLDELRASVDARAGRGGQSISAKLTPDGAIRVPALGTVFAQGLTLEELQREMNERYRRVAEGIEVTPSLTQRAPRFVYVLGEVNKSGRFEMEGPTTVTQAIAMAGNWIYGGRLRQIVVLRRNQDWQLVATTVNLEGTLLGNEASPADEIWLRDSDIIIVPKSPVRLGDDFIELIFTRGIYGVFPLQTVINFAKLSTI